MKILQGLFDHMVLQRNRRTVSEAAFAGECAGPGRVIARVSRGGKPAKGFSAKTVGKASRGRFSGRLKGLPTGGPYSIELSIVAPGRAKANEVVRVDDVLVGDVWVVGGQSNMCGAGTGKLARPDPLVRGFYMSDRWAVVKEPLHNALWDAVDQVHIDINGGVRPKRPAGKLPIDTGPGASFGREMRRLTGVPQGLIACGHGGTSMDQWDPALKGKGGPSLYGASVRRVEKNGGKVAGVLWYQGESDASPAGAETYADKTANLIQSFRRDFGDRQLPFVGVQLGRVAWPQIQADAWNRVQDEQRRLAESIPHCAFVPAADLELHDIIHIDGPAQENLGRRMAQAMRALRRERGSGPPPIALSRIKLQEGPASGAGTIEVHFENLDGPLRSSGRPVGFTVMDPAPVSCVFRTELHGDKVILRSGVEAVQLSKQMLSYGNGTDPCCNITDGAGRPLPAFGPVPLGEPRAVTNFVTTFRLSPFLPSSDKLGGVRHPDLAKLELTPRRFIGALTDLHAEMEALSPQEVFVYLACRLECPEEMKLAALLGYDGPVKFWLDGRELFHDPNGTNPALPDKRPVPFTASPGIHDLLIAFDSNHNKAWGIFLRIERLDVSKEQLEQGPGGYVMPVVKE